MRFLLAAAVLASVLVCRSSVGAPDEWLVPGAELRVNVKVEDKPDDPSAGVIVIIQNGGVLPQPAADFVVLDSSGKELRSECVWNNPREGLGIVFENPSNGGLVSIYLKAAPSVRAWTPASSFRPGLLLYTQAGVASLPEARGMASEAPPASHGRMGLVPMIADRENRFGPSDSYTSYYTGWINVPESGSIYFGTISSDGSTVAVDGKVVADWPGRHGWEEGRKGQHGGSIPLAKGPHRVEYFHFAASGTPQTLLVWRMPGARGKDIPESVTPKDLIQSGTAKVVSAATRKGSPVAIFSKRTVSYLLYNDRWADLYELTTPYSDKSKDVVCTWQISGGYEVKGPTLFWVVPRGEVPQVTLTVSNAQGSSSSTKAIYSDGLPKAADLPKEKHAREEYCQALANRITGAPRGKDATADWPPTFWSMLGDIVEPGEGEELLGGLLEQPPSALQKISNDVLRRLEAIYAEDVAKDKVKAPALFARMIAEERDPAVRFRWQLKQLEFYLYELGDIATARQLAAKLVVEPFRSAPEDGALRMIAFGDIEWLDGATDKARQFYGAAQAMNQKSSHVYVPMSSSLDRATPVGAQPGQKAKDGIYIAAATGTETDWRKRAVQQNAYASQVNSLLEQKYIAEARKALTDWEIEFPLSKLDGDYVLSEAKYYSALGDDERALRVLKAYRHNVEISNTLPATMELELKCLEKLKRHAEIKELAADVKKRFPDLPLAKEADEASRR